MLRTKPHDCQWQQHSIPNLTPGTVQKCNPFWDRIPFVNDPEWVARLARLEEVATAKQSTLENDNVHCRHLVGLMESMKKQPTEISSSQANSWFGISDDNSDLLLEHVCSCVVRYAFRVLDLCLKPQPKDVKSNHTYTLSTHIKYAYHLCVTLLRSSAPQPKREKELPVWHTLTSVAAAAGMLAGEDQWLSLCDGIRSGAEELEGFIPWVDISTDTKPEESKTEKMENSETKSPFVRTQARIRDPLTERAIVKSLRHTVHGLELLRSFRHGLAWQASFVGMMDTKNPHFTKRKSECVGCTGQLIPLRPGALIANHSMVNTKTILEFRSTRQLRVARIVTGKTNSISDSLCSSLIGTILKNKEQQIQSKPKEEDSDEDEEEETKSTLTWEDEPDWLRSVTERLAYESIHRYVALAIRLVQLLWWTPLLRGDCILMLHRLLTVIEHEILIRTHSDIGSPHTSYDQKLSTSSLRCLTDTYEVTRKIFDSEVEDFSFSFGHRQTVGVCDDESKVMKRMLKLVDDPSSEEKGTPGSVMCGVHKDCVTIKPQVHS